MSWKIYLIIISNANGINTAQVPAKIGLGDLRPVREIHMQEAQYENAVSIGKYGDKIFIVSQDLVFNFFDKAPSEVEKSICDSFPNSEIAVLVLNGTVDLYGYNLIKEGKRQRVKSGADGELFIDFGEKLSEELAISKEDVLSSESIKDIQADNSKDQANRIIDQEISIEATFHITARYFNKQINMAGSDYEKIVLTLYE